MPDHNCHDGDKPCPCPPHPDLWKLAKESAAGTAPAQKVIAPEVMSVLKAAVMPTGPVSGLNDGAVIPPMEFPEGTPLRTMRTAALERAPVSEQIR